MCRIIVYQNGGNASLIQQHGLLLAGNNFGHFYPYFYISLNHTPTYLSDKVLGLYYNLKSYDNNWFQQPYTKVLFRMGDRSLLAYIAEISSS